MADHAMTPMTSLRAGVVNGVCRRQVRCSSKVQERSPHRSPYETAASAIRILCGSEARSSFVGLGETQARPDLAERHKKYRRRTARRS